MASHCRYFKGLVPYSGCEQKIYVDGELVKTAISSTSKIYGDELNQSIINIGNTHFNEQVGNTSHRFKGDIDEVAVWQSTLSDEQVKNIYRGESNGGSGGNPFGDPGDLSTFYPIMWWRMGDTENVSSQIADVINGKDLTITAKPLAYTLNVLNALTLLNLSLRI